MEWIWDGGRVCLDFVNTLRDRKQTARETLAGPADLERWLGEGELLVREARVAASAGDLAEARRLREAVDRCVRAVAGGGLPESADLALVNDAAARAPRRAVRAVVDGGRLVASAPVRTAEDVAGALGLVARDAVELLLAAEVRRVRVCGSDTCGLRYVDRSPAGNRRWCSMARCGNRTKVRAHAERVRGR
ncbi:CGNR zinc finger domain-containing protein [Streptomyces boninensis]|uniref:CGNR zinc finger domain-containing protein n=1 Tax=Streptomyces boninensis TaxID=2039455 RepID=UPI003B211220